MEKFSKWRDPGTGVAPFIYPIPPSTDALPLLVRLVAVPLTWILAGLRTILILALLLLHWLVVEIVFSVCLVVPPLHTVLVRIATAILIRAVLLLLGHLWIPVEIVSLRRTGRAPPAIAFSPGYGDVIVANSSGFLDLLYLAFRFNPTFLIPVSSTGSKASASAPAKITSWRRVSLLSAVLASGSLPERSERGESFQDASMNSKGPVVIFPECTTSNNRALLRFGTLLETHGAKTAALKTFVLSFKYDIPSAFATSATLPIPSSFSPITDIFSICTSPLPRKLAVRQLHASESPAISANPRAAEWEALAETLAGAGRWKRTALGWEDKAAFLEFRAKRR